MPVARLTRRALLAVTGPDARAFLHGLLTQNIETLAPGEVRFGALLGPQGRLLFDLFLFGTAQGVILDCAADRRDELLKRLSLYRLRAAVTLTPLDAAVMAAWGDDAAADTAPDPRLPGLGGRFIDETGLSAQTAREDDWLAHQRACGVPDLAADALIDKDYPLELNLDLLNGVDFHKGCFIGQETTSRMKRRGSVKSRLIPVIFDGPPPPFGAEILNGERRAGEMRSGGDGRGIALLRLDRMEGDLTIEGRAARADPPDWLSG